MGLKNGTLALDGTYTGSACCDCCGFTEMVKVAKDKFLPPDGSPKALERPWRHVGFRYRPWIACTTECELALNKIKDREEKKDSVAAASHKVKKESQRRPYPIAGTWEDGLVEEAPVEAVEA